MGQYEKNIQLFKKHSPVIYNSLIQEDNSKHLTIEKLDGGKNYILQSKNAKCFIHSIYDINREMELMFKDVNREVESIVLFGLGCGYSIEYIYNKFKHIKNIIIIEPNLSIFKDLLGIIDIYDVISTFENVSFIINRTKQEASYMLQDIITDDIYRKYAFVYNISYRTIYEGYYEYLNKIILESINHKLVNIITQENFKYIWPINTFRNLKYNTALVDNLFGRYSGVPAILVSAGPSLSKNIHLLNKVNNRAIIVAVGSAIKILNNAGIEPDFYFAVDGTPENKMIFEDIKTENTVLIYGDKLYYDILPYYKGKRLKMILNMDFINKYIYDQAQIPYIESKSGFSIANVALGILEQFGCNKVIFMGQDLCYTGNKEYAEGSWKEEDLDFNNANFIKGKDIYGNEVYTIPSYLGMKKMLEDYISNHPRPIYINATEGGLGIDGASISTFEEVLSDHLNMEYDIRKIVNDVLSLYNQEQDNKKIYEVILNMEKQISDIIEICDNLVIFFKSNKLKKKSLKYISEQIEDHYKKLVLNPFYKEVISTTMHSVTNSLNMKYKHCKDENIVINSELSKIIEVRELLYLINGIIGEFKGDKNLDIVFE